MKKIELMLYRRFFSYLIPASYLLAGVLLVAGCQREEMDYPMPGSDAVVTFNPQLDGQPVMEILPQTRVDDVDFQTFGFTVCGYQSKGTQFEQAKDVVKPEIFKDKTSTGGCFQTVNYDLTKNKFITLARPWVVAASDYLSFFGWSDNDRDAYSGIIEHSPETQTGYPWIDVLLPDAIDKQTDVVTAQSVDLPNNALISAIDLQFRHILSKISFKGYSSTGAGVEISGFKIKYGGSTFNKARFQFGSKGEFDLTKYTTKHKANTTVPIAASFPEVTAANSTTQNAVLLGNMMQIPQAAPDGFITAVVTYKTKQMVNGVKITSPEVTREIPINGMNLQQGFHYILAFDFMIDKVDVSLNSIADWNEIGTERLPLVAGPRGDVMLWLDAGDAPFEFQGQQYWLDRSGYNRHCKIVNTTTPKASKITYNAAKKVYVFDNEQANDKDGTVTSYVELPDLGKVKEITAQLLIMQTDRSLNKGYGSPLIYCPTKLTLQQSSNPLPLYNIPDGDKRQFAMHLYETAKAEGENGIPRYGLIDFDTANGNNVDGEYDRLMSDLFNADQRKGYSLITLRKKDNFKAVSRNASHNLTKNVADAEMTLTYGYLGGDFDGEIKSLKIMSRSITDAEIQSDFAYVKKLHALKDDPVVPLGNLPANAGEPNGNNGLIAYFDANDKPLVVTSGYYPSDIIYWEDRSGNGNHLQIFGRTGRLCDYPTAAAPTDLIEYNTTSKDYIFSGTTGGYMKLVKSLGALEEYLVIFGVVNDGAGTTSPSNVTERMLAHFTEVDDVIDASKGFASYAPTNMNGLDVWANNKICEFRDATNALQTWGIGRSKYNTLKDQPTMNFYASRNGANTPYADIGTAVPNLKHCYIGSNANKKLPFKGKIKTIRIYKRTVQPSEIISMNNNLLNGITK